MRKSKVIFIKNALILTVSGLVIRFIGMLFRIWLAGVVGAEGIGLYGQVFSFYMLASAFASTGINTAVSRLVSEELSLGRDGGARTVLIKCSAVTLFVALLSCAAVFLLAKPLAHHVIGDNRAADSLRTLTLSLPFMGLSSCLKGYFIARKKAAPASSSQIFEQFVRIGVIALTLSLSAKEGLAAACRGIVFGDAVAEVFSFMYIYISYLIDKKQHLVCTVGTKPPYSVIARLRHIALPITAGRYLNSILRTAENVLVPRQLQSFGMNKSEALSTFGVIKGMALPLIFFPASFLNALSTLLIPEMSEATVSGKEYKVRYTAEKCIHITLISSLPFAVIFLFTGDRLGRLVYGDHTAGEAILLLAPLVPMMYLDSVCDGLLKGLDKQFFIFRNSVIDSLCRLGLICLVLPKFGFLGFIGIMYISNFFTCIMNLFKLKSISGAEVKWWKWLVLPLVSAMIIGIVTALVLRPFPLSDLLYCLIFIFSTGIAYAVTMLWCRCISIDDFK